MANTYTSNTQLAMPASGDRTWNVPVNGNAQVLDALAPVGELNVTTTEVPSASLNVKIAQGAYIEQDGSVAVYAGITTTAMTASTTNYLFLDLTSSGALVKNTTGFPTTAHVPLATVVAGSSTITSITDWRVAFTVMGSFADGVNLTFGTTTGTQIGTSASQKLAMFGATPIAQPANTVDILVGLINVGLRATGGTPGLNLQGGTLTCGNAAIADGGNVVVGTSTGTKIGTSATQKLALWGGTPVVQPSGAAQAALTDSSGGTAGSTLAACTATNSTDQSATINSNFATLNALVESIRTALVAMNAIKGSA